jgi:hypothetical protein
MVMPRSCSSGSESVSVVPAEEEHPLGDGGLAGVDVGDDADVADFFDLAGHISSKFRVQGSKFASVFPHQL